MVAFVRFKGYDFDFYSHYKSLRGNESEFRNIREI